MSSICAAACREIAQIAKDAGILGEMGTPENYDVLVYIVYELLQHVGIVSEEVSDDLVSPIA
jgi:hypothetical protein